MTNIFFLIYNSHVVIEEWLNGRAAVSKTAGCVFESRLLCQACIYGCELFLFVQRNGSAAFPTKTARLRVQIARLTPSLYLRMQAFSFLIFIFVYEIITTTQSSGYLYLQLAYAYKPTVAVILQAPIGIRQNFFFQFGNTFDFSV